MFGLISSFALLVLLGVGTLWRPSIAVAGVLCMYGIKQWGQSSSLWIVEHRTLANISVGLLVLIGLLRTRFGLAGRVRLATPVWLLTICLYCYAFITLTWSPNFERAWQEWAFWTPYVLTVAVSAPLLVSSSEDVKRFCNWTLVVGGTVCLFVLFFAQWGARGLILSGEHFQYDDFARETNPLAISELAGAVGIVAFLSIPAMGSLLKKLACSALIPIALAVILRSGTRGQLLAFAIASLVGWPLAAQRRHVGTWIAMMAIASVVITAGLLLWQHLGEGVLSFRWSGENLAEEDVAGRLSLAATLLGKSAANPLTFIFGLGSSSAFLYLGIYPHITALEVLAEEGIIGAVIYAAIMIGVARSVGRIASTLRTNPDPASRWAFAVLITLFLYELILTSKQGSLLSGSYTFAYAAMLGRMASWSTATAPAAETTPTGVLPDETWAHAPSFSNLMR
jgi:hypothetical protein